MTGSGTRSAGQYHWKHSQYKSQGSHQNGTETHLGCMNGRFDDIDTCIHLHLGKLYDQDRILCRQTYQGNKPDLEIDIVMQSGSPNPQISSQGSNRQRQQYSNRYNPTFILCSQEKENEQEYKCKHHTGLSSGFLFLIRQSTPFHTDIIRQMFAGDLLHSCHRFSGTVSGCSHGTDRSRREHIELLDRTGPGCITCRT